LFKIKHVYDRSTSAKNRFFSKIYIPGDSDGTPLCSRILLHRSISSDASNNLDENDADNYEPWEFNLKDEFLKSLMLDDETDKNVHDYIFDDSVTTYKLSHHDAGFALKKNNLIDSTDIVFVHNNSGGHGLTGYLLTNAITLGGNAIDFVDDDVTINVIRGHGFEEYDRVKWGDRCVRTSWSHRNSSLANILLYKLKSGI
jgi:hypothetical protein